MVYYRLDPLGLLLASHSQAVMLLVNLSYCALQPDASSSQGAAGGGQHRRFLSAILNGALGKEQVLYCPKKVMVYLIKRILSCGDLGSCPQSFILVCGSAEHMAVPTLGTWRCQLCLD